MYCLATVVTPGFRAHRKELVGRRAIIIVLFPVRYDLPFCPLYIRVCPLSCLKMEEAGEQDEMVN
jgi:hypothetical protein